MLLTLVSLLQTFISLLLTLVSMLLTFISLLLTLVSLLLTCDSLLLPFLEEGYPSSCSAGQLATFPVRPASPLLEQGKL